MSSIDEAPRKRPTSPHMTIYKPQISSVMSILHRLTGVALFGGFSIMTWWIIILIFSKFNTSLLNVVECEFTKIFLYGIVAAFFYHLCNGIRHLFWDMGKGFSIRAMNISGWLVLISTIILTLGFWHVTN